MGLYGLVFVLLIEFDMEAFVWICICVLHCICYDWDGMDLHLCFALYLLWMGWYGSARRLVARSCSQVVPQLPHRGCPNTDSHRSQVDKSSKLFPVTVSQHAQCVIYWVSSCQPQSYVHAWSLGERQHCVEWFMLTWWDGGSIEKDAVRQLYIISCSSLPSTWPGSLYVGAQASIAIGITRNGPTPPFTGSHHWTSNQHRISGAAPTLIFIRRIFCNGSLSHVCSREWPTREALWQIDQRTSAPITSKLCGMHNCIIITCLMHISGDFLPAKVSPSPLIEFCS